MSLVFLLLTAAASAGADPVVSPPAGAAPTVYPTQYAEPEPAEKPGFFSRLRGLFRRKTDPVQQQSVSTGVNVPIPPATPPVPTVVTSPAPVMLPPKETEAPPAPAVEQDKKAPAVLDSRFEKRVSRSADYTKLTGQLFHVHIDGGLWVLRYAPLSQEDANGGSVVLTRDQQMDNFREGDLVEVEGKLLDQKGSARLGARLYRVQTITLVDRPRQ